MIMNYTFVIVICTFIFHQSKGEGNLEEDKYGVKFASECEVCKLVMKELEETLNSKDSSGVLETSYNIDSKNKKVTSYRKSELRLLESLEETCKGMLDYRIHKERMDSTRWAKAVSQTFQALHGLVNKGVKVELGIPYELWDEPSAEVSHLKTQCEQFVENNEDSITDWYFGDQAGSLTKSICPSVLNDSDCLKQPYGETIQSPDTSKNVNTGSKVEL